MQFLSAYAAALIVFGILDAVWLSIMGRLLYRPTLGSLMLDNLRWAPALVFYFLFPVGVVHFAVLPAFAAGSLQTALVNGGFLGLLAYATYDLTNYATLRVWTLTLTLVDVVYGAAATAIVAGGAYGALRVLASAGWI
ncbi:DUF2177 family protein [Phreatobacter cathodiphilus]|uniref:DUF2177 domain-containing protein n=1 Tax=Phreatobacter cathodiphilus TaxID=1868589 RepID=A0A2S0NDF9_9HYPH|nr:DUF2177 family protein [Phreatobacter cathodiphilus]AVO46185.1 DUF2177 domain-containing protein [Phreatobacter cathodiphilus]